MEEIGFTVAKATVGAAANVAFNFLLDATLKVVHFKKQDRRLETSTQILLHQLQQINDVNQEMDLDMQIEKDVLEKVRQGIDVVKKSQTIPRWNLWKRYVYSKKLTNLDDDIARFCQQYVPVQILLDGRINACRFKRRGP